MTMFIAEIVTGILIFIGCMGCIGTMGVVPMQTAITFGLTVNLIIMIRRCHQRCCYRKPEDDSDSSGLHPGSGATLGYGLLKIITPAELFNDGSSNSTVGLCITIVHPRINSVQAVLIKVFCTSCIFCATSATWDPRCAHTTDSTALRFGLSIIAISLAASPYTGCSMNPARTFGSAFWNSAWKDQWIYWLGLCLGSVSVPCLERISIKCYLQKNN